MFRRRGAYLGKYRRLKLRRPYLGRRFPHYFDCGHIAQMECDHEWESEEWDQGDPSTPYFMSGWFMVCALCGETKEDDGGYDDEPSRSDFD